jgi:hypothetical protein
MKPVKYRIVSSTKSEFLNIELYMTLDKPYPGKGCSVFGHDFTITQVGKYVTLASATWVITMEELEPEVFKKVWGAMITDPSDLRINFEIDIFLGTHKSIQIHETDRLTQEGGVTMKALAKFLIKQWPQIKSISGIQCPVVWDYKYKVMYLRDNWNLSNLASIALTREGSFIRYDESGRVVNP